MVKKKLDTSLNGIPRGDYCYTVDGPWDENDSLPIRLCPYWQRTKDGARCQYLNLDSKKNDHNLIWDQVKVCGINPSPDEPDDY